MAKIKKIIDKPDRYIRVSQSTKDRLKQLGNKGETYEQIIRRLTHNEI